QFATDLYGEEQVVRGQRNAVMPARAGPYHPRGLHASVREQLPEAVVKRWDCLGEHRMQAVVLRDGKPRIQKRPNRRPGASRTGAQVWRSREADGDPFRR